MENQPVDNNDAYESISIIPLGGLGEVGMNCTLYEAQSEIMIVDCGLYLPKEKAYGIDFIIPSFSYLLERRDNVKGIVLTHGHEDHIGAIPYLLRDMNPPIFGSPFALELVRQKLKEHGLYQHAKLHEVGVSDVIDIGPFSVEFIHVNHSIPQTMSLAIRSRVGLIVHATDFKVDNQPLYEETIDLARFASMGEEGVLCLLSDSTNAVLEGYSDGERKVADRLEELVRQATGRVIVTQFASNVHRIQSLLNIAHKTSRRVLMMGRSLLQITEIARKLGLLHLPEESILIQPGDIDAFRHDELLVLTTGSQGEPRSALTRVAMDDHPWFSILRGDYVIFSSRVIPGNEIAVNRICDHLYRRGAVVFQFPEEQVHASGHAYRGEQQLMINLTKPLTFVPIHGDYRQLARHAAIAEKMGVEDTFILDNGDVLTIWEDDSEVTAHVPAGKVIVDGKAIEEATGVAMRDRRKLARNGIVVAWLVLDGSTGEVVHGPGLLLHGVVGVDDEKELIEEAARKALKGINELNIPSRKESAEVSEAVRIAVRRVFSRRLENKPVVVPIIHEL